mgnify:FL=1
MSNAQHSLAVSRQMQLVRLMSNLDFPERLRAAMRYSSDQRNKPWTQQQLARKAGTQQGTIGGWMSGRSLPSSKLLFEIADALGVSARWLATGKGAMLGPRQENGNYSTRTVTIEQATDIVLLVMQTLEASGIKLGPTPTADLCGYLLESDEKPTAPAVERVLRLVSSSG